jgi:chromate transporter
MITRIFVNKRKDITETELMDYNAFCQLLPGATSTQLLTSIAYKRGGIPLAVLTCLIWMIPACLIMGTLSFIITHSNLKTSTNQIFQFIQPMAIGFLLYAGISSYKQNVKNPITHIIMFIGMILLYYFIKTPWVLPLLIIFSGVATSFSKKRFPDQEKVQKKQIRWFNLILFVLLFITAGIVSEIARKQNWQDRKLFNLFENNYRFGSIVFGGGDVLLPMMLDQYVARPNDIRIQKNNPGIIKIDKSDLLNGYGIVKAVPGPVFSFASFTGGMALSDEGTVKQVAGCVTGALSIFLPGILLLFFFLPVWHNLQKYAVILRALEGIRAVTVGLIFAAAIYLFTEMFPLNYSSNGLISIVFILCTPLLMIYTRISPPMIVVCTLILGYCVPMG